MRRLRRIRLALLSAFVIAFAQIAVAAQPWPLGAALHRHYMVQPSTVVDAVDHCAHHRAQDDGAPVPKAPPPSPNYCEVHCQDAAQPDALVVAAAAPIPDAGLAVPLAEVLLARDSAADRVDARCASPPVRLLFARFLI